VESDAEGRTRPLKPKVTIISGKGVSQTINYLWRIGTSSMAGLGRPEQERRDLLLHTGGDIVEISAP